MQHQSCIYHIPFKNLGAYCLSPEDIAPLECKCVGCKWYAKEQDNQTILNIADEIALGWHRVPYQLFPPDFSVPASCQLVIRYPSHLDEREATILVNEVVNEENKRNNGKDLLSEAEIEKKMYEYAVQNNINPRAREQALVLHDALQEILKLTKEAGLNIEKQSLLSVLNTLTEEYKQIKDVQMLNKYRQSLGQSQEDFKFNLRALFLLWLCCHKLPEGHKDRVLDDSQYWKTLDEFMKLSPKIHKLLLDEYLKMILWLRVDFYPGSSRKVPAGRPSLN